MSNQNTPKEFIVLSGILPVAYFCGKNLWFNFVYDGKRIDKLRIGSMKKLDEDEDKKEDVVMFGYTQSRNKAQEYTLIYKGQKRYESRMFTSSLHDYPDYTFFERPRDWLVKHYPHFFEDAQVLVLEQERTSLVQANMAVKRLWKMLHVEHELKQRKEKPVKEPPKKRQKRCYAEVVEDDMEAEHKVDLSAIDKPLESDFHSERFCKRILCNRKCRLELELDNALNNATDSAHDPTYTDLVLDLDIENYYMQDKIAKLNAKIASLTMF